MTWIKPMQWTSGTSEGGTFHELIGAGDIAYMAISFNVENGWWEIHDIFLSLPLIIAGLPDDVDRIKKIAEDHWRKKLVNLQIETAATSLPIPLLDRIIVEPIPVEAKTAGGIIVPDTAKERPSRGIVRAKPPYHGDTDPHAGIPIGNIVVYSKHAGTSIEVEGREHLILRVADVLCVL